MKVGTFLVGASKSGTSSLSNILASHPDVCMCQIKEPNYFSDDLPQDVFSESHAKNLDEYHGLWGDCHDDCSVFCEASVGYFYSRMAAENIKRYNPNAKILVMLRHPVGRLVSAHSFRLNSGNEDVELPVEAYKLDSLRMRGKFLPKGCSNFRPYREMMDYATQIERFLNCFPRNQIHIVLMEDLIEKRDETVKKMWGFLGIRDVEIEVLPHENRSVSARSRFVLSLMSPNSFLVRRFYVPLRKFRMIKWLGQTIRRMNLKEARNALLEEEEVRFLENDFREMVDRTEKLTGVELKSRWEGFA